MPWLRGTGVASVFKNMFMPPSTTVSAPGLRSLVLAALTLTAGGAPSQPCSDSSFSHDASGRQIRHLNDSSHTLTAAACEQTCCLDATCVVWQFKLPHQCWTGSSVGPRGNGDGWTGRSKVAVPDPPLSPSPSPPPSPPGPPAVPITETIELTAANGLGARFDGVGAISGGGATSKLLMA